MNCATAKEWMPHYIDGLLSPELELELRLHIESCPDCALWLEEAKELAALWNGSDSEAVPDGVMEIPDLTATVMNEIGRMEGERRLRATGSTTARRRTAPRTSWAHYCLAVGLTFLLLQLGVFENMAYGITQINGQMSSSLGAWFDQQQGAE